jgi:hypothetical protein
MTQNTTPASANTTRGDPAQPAPAGVAQHYLAGPSGAGDRNGTAEAAPTLPASCPPGNHTRPANPVFRSNFPLRSKLHPMNVTPYPKEPLQCHNHGFRPLCQCDLTGRRGWSEGLPRLRDGLAASIPGAAIGASEAEVPRLALGSLRGLHQAGHDDRV